MARIGVPAFLRSYFAQIARTSASDTNSPRSAAASDSVSASSSSGARSTKACSSSMPLLPRDHVHLNIDVLLAGSQNDPGDGGDVGVVAAFGEDDVVVADHDRVGRVEADPAVLVAAPDRNPGVGGVGAFQTLLALR